MNSVSHTELDFKALPKPFGFVDSSSLHSGPQEHDIPCWALWAYEFYFSVQFSYRWQPSVLPIIYEWLSLLFLHDIKDQATSSWDLCFDLNSLPCSPQPPPPSSMCSLLTVPGVSSSLFCFSSVKCCLEHFHPLQQLFFFSKQRN